MTTKDETETKAAADRAMKRIEERHAAALRAGVDVAYAAGEEAGRAAMADELTKRYEDGYSAGHARGVYDGRQEMADEFSKARATSYNEGVGGEDLCGAPEKDTVIAGVPVVCMRPKGHDLGPLDRHKAVFGEPHVAISWNDPEADYASPSADPDNYSAGDARE